ncbi:hypothetical protein H0N98_02830 [Candidatus Micrarchaeota archaeon]|nr:hypothetical protein [Candidatus Micrarchaeota archaeon]
MIYKQAKEERKEPSESIRDALDAVKPKPMSVLSKERFFKQNVSEIKCEPLLFNSKLFKHLPIRKEDVENKLSVFVDRSGNAVTMELLGLTAHGRSFFLNVKFSDRFGNVYNYIDIKGAGMHEKEWHETIRVYGYDEDIGGLLNYDDAKIDWDMSNLFLRNRIRTSAPIAMGRVEEIIFAGGKRPSMKDLRMQGWIPPYVEEEYQRIKYVPVIYIRGFSEIMRLQDAEKEDYERFANAHGMTLVEYRDWWIEEVAKNLARMHNLGKAHNALNVHNLTLDGCIVDHDAVKSFSKSQDAWMFSNEISNSAGILGGFTRRLGYSSDYEVPNEKLFLEKYFENRTNITERQLSTVYAQFRY